MTTAPDLDDLEGLALRWSKPKVLLKEFVRKRPTLRGAAEATDRPVDASAEAEERGTRRLELRVPDGADYVTPLVRVSFRQPNFLVLQAWEGTVQDVSSDSFHARIRDLTDGSRPDEIVEMYIEDVDDSDAPLLGPGAVFYWNIGYLEGSGFPRQRTSRVTFRRIPRFLASARPALSLREIRDALAE